VERDSDNFLRIRVMRGSLVTHLTGMALLRMALGWGYAPAFGDRPDGVPHWRPERTAGL
jgi:hypothetical protein